MDITSTIHFKKTSCIATEGVTGLLNVLANSSVLNGLYTGNTPIRARLKLDAANIDYSACFDRNVCYFQGGKPNRLDGSEVIRERFANDEIIVVGDSPLDYKLALNLDAYFIQVGMRALEHGNEVKFLGCVPDFSENNQVWFLSKVLGRD